MLKVRSCFSTRDCEDVLAGRLFLSDVSEETRDHVMMTVRRKASELVNSRKWDSRDFPWFLKKELEEAIERIVDGKAKRF